MSTETAILPVIKDIVAHLKRRPELAANLADDADLVADVGLDSLEMLQFMLELEEKLAIRIDFDRLDYEDMRSASRLAHCLAGMPAAAPAR